MITNLVLRSRVQRGMYWLKAEGPKYSADVTRINWGRLNLRNNRSCVLGQAVHVPTGALSNGYCEVFLQVASDFLFDAGPGLKDTSDRKAAQWMRLHGFDLDSHIEENVGTWNRLRDAWIEAAITEGLHQPVGAR